MRGLLFGEIAIVISCGMVALLAKPLIAFSDLGEESARICMQVFTFINSMKLLFWAPSFMMSYGMRAAGDMKFSMIVSTLSMWLMRVSLCVILVRVLHMGLIAVWIGMAADWFVRGVIFFVRFLGDRWMEKAVVKQ